MNDVTLVEMSGPSAVIGEEEHKASLSQQKQNGNSSSSEDASSPETSRIRSHGNIRQLDLPLKKLQRAGAMKSRVLRERVSIVRQAQSNSISVTSKRSSFVGQDISSIDSLKSLEKNKHPQCCLCITMINPLSLRHSIWDLFVAIILVISLITLPLGMAFDDIADSLFAANLLFDGVFLMDILITFCTGYIDPNDVLIMTPADVAVNYLSSWFFLDMVSSIPIDAILRIVEASQRGNTDGTDVARLTKTFKMVRLVRMAKLVRLFRLSRVAKYVRSARLWLEHHLKFEMPIAVMKVSKLIVLLGFLGHWLGCVFFFIPKQFDFPYNSWVVQNQITDLSTGQQYMWSLIKALYMMIGGEEMLPSGNSIGCEDISEYCAIESWMTLVSLYLGAIFSALLISEVGLIVTSLDRSRQLFYDRLNAVNEYMRANKLSPELREHVREYFSLRYSDQKMFNEEAILRDMSPNLHIRIREETSHNIIERVPLLHDQMHNHAFIDNVVTKLRGPLICFPDEIIFYENTTAHAMHFIYSGVVGIYTTLTKGESNGDMQSSVGNIVAAISNGCYFGEVGILLKCRRTATAKSETISVLHTLTEEAINACLDDAPHVREYMVSIAETRKQRVAQMSPDYTGVVDSKLEEDEYIDAEDAKTEIFQFESASREIVSGVRRRMASPAGPEFGKTRVRRKSRIFEFNKSGDIERKAGESLKALRQATNRAVSTALSRRRHSFQSIVKASSPSNVTVENSHDLMTVEHNLEDGSLGTLRERESKVFSIHEFESKSLPQEKVKEEIKAKVSLDHVIPSNETNNMLANPKNDKLEENVDEKYGIDDHLIKYDYF